MSPHARVVFVLAVMQAASAADAQSVATYEQKSHVPSVAMTIQELEDLVIAIHERTARANHKFDRFALSENASVSNGISKVSANGSFAQNGFFGRALDVATEASYTMTSKDAPLPISNIRLQFGDRESVLEISGTSQKDVEELTTLCLSDIKLHSVLIAGESTRGLLLTVFLFAWSFGVFWALHPENKVSWKVRTLRACILLTAIVPLIVLPWNIWWAGARFVRTELEWYQEWGGAIAVVGIIGSFASVAGVWLYLRDRNKTPPTT